MARYQKPLNDTGGCGCGACRYVIATIPFIAYCCHCRACQKLTASAFLTCLHVPKEDLSVTSGSVSRQARTADSGNTVETWFCNDCGSTLYAENSARPRVRTVHVGSLDHPDRVSIGAHIWMRSKLPWVTVNPDDRLFDEAGDWTEDYVHDPSRYRL